MIAPHPDDEVLGCGGLIQQVKRQRGKVYVLFLTIGNTKDFSHKGSSSISEREKEIKRVASFLQFDDYDVGFTDDKYHLQLDAYGQKQVINLIERTSSVAIEKIRPTIVAFPSEYSYNQDHQIAARATISALRPAERTTKHFVPYVLGYEMAADAWSTTNERMPNFFLPLDKTMLALKLKAMNLYASQVRPSPNMRSIKTIESLARLRGALCASDFAEAFMLYRAMA